MKEGRVALVIIGLLFAAMTINHCLWKHEVKTKNQKIKALSQQIVRMENREFINITVEVKSGDCLWKIAEKEMGDARLWPLIWARNFVAIGTNPHLIFPGQVFIIPASDGI